MEHTTRKSIMLKGIVVSGAGEGRYFMSIEGYRKQFIEKLGFDPYAGTLNVKLQGTYADRLEELKGMEGIKISGFSHEGKVLGGVAAFKGKVSGIGCALIVPEKSRYKDVAEIISKDNLRETLSLEDGTEIDIEVDIQAK